MNNMQIPVPFFRPDLREAEIQAAVGVLRSGWLTSGPVLRRFEEEFAAAVGARHAVGVNSCTAALHLAVEALGLKPAQAVLVPTMTFAATAEVVRYLGGIPILVDCDPVTANIDLEDAERKLRLLTSGDDARFPRSTRAVGLAVVHVGGFMCDIDRIQQFAARHALWTLEDAAHAFPAAWRRSDNQSLRRCGEATGDVTCFSFYANKTITTGEGGMAVTDDARLADRMRLMSLHGLSHDAWSRYSTGGSWDYQIVAPGFKYNLTDLAAAIGVQQLRRAEEMRVARERIARQYLLALTDVDELETPPTDDNRVHAWHLFPIRLRLDRLAISRNQFVDELKRAGVMCSVHWRPLHLHPYYQQTFSYSPSDCPNASTLFDRIVSLPIFPVMTSEEIEAVITVVKRTVAKYRLMDTGHQVDCQGVAR